MKLPLRQLSRHLKDGLAGIYLVAADEPFFVGEATDQIRTVARNLGFEERDVNVIERGFRWDSLAASANNLSLFSAKRIVELRMNTPRPGDAGARAIRALAEDPDPDRLVIISINAKLDSSSGRSVWVRTIEKHGVVVQIWPIERAELPRWITEHATKLKLILTRDAARLLADRVEGNLQAADQELRKLALIAGGAEIDETAIAEAVANSARFDVFRLTDAIVAGDVKRALKVLVALRDEGTQPTLIAWALSREFSLLARLKFAARTGERLDNAMARQGVWRNRQAAIKGALNRLEWEDLVALLNMAARLDRTLKGVEPGPGWASLTDLVLAALKPATPRRVA